VLEAIERIHAELGTTTVLITHNAVIADMADRVLVMGDGRIVTRSGATPRGAAPASCRGDAGAAPQAAGATCGACAARCSPSPW
jgi:energy-coupling factor transporter ATP-binding protein EcfA2